MSATPAGTEGESTGGLGPLAAFVPSRRFVRFLAVGVLNTIFGYGLFAALVLARLHYALATAICSVVGILFNFQTIGRMVFQSRDPALLFRFAGVYAFIYVLNVGVLRVSAAAGVHVLAAQAALLLPMAAVAYTLHRRFVFQREGVTR